MSEITPKSEHSLQIIARIHNDFPEKFGVPHQSGWLKKQKAQIIFESGIQEAGSLPRN